VVEGNLIEWQKWNIRIGFNAREGLVLHQVGSRGCLPPNAGLLLRGRSLSAIMGSGIGYLGSACKPTSLKGNDLSAFMKRLMEEALA
jgi:hypothetical protein